MDLPPWHAAARLDARVALGEVRDNLAALHGLPITLRVAVVGPDGELLGDEIVGPVEPLTVRLRRRSREPPARLALDTATLALIVLVVGILASALTLTAYLRFFGLDC